MNNKQGFTLLELLIVLTVLTVLVMIATPSFIPMIQETRLKAVTEELFNAVQLTRTNAITHNQRVTMRNFGSWELGWEIFLDPDNDGLRSNDEHLILKKEALKEVQIAPNSPVKDYISFISSGESRKTGSPLGAFQAGTLHVCAQEVQAAQALILSRSGRMRIEKADIGNCP
ncbi:GspH/FimT family pseudopilin [Microbulbifer sp. DLAB2-AF]|uniref:GspH/FimT family pseudopilin n=1 Tax=Microbulbifer sp. DLAB2-AF TaxID=3243395 RepID=UPI004039C489